MPTEAPITADLATNSPIVMPQSAEPAEELRAEDPDVIRALTMAQTAAEVLHSRTPVQASTTLVRANKRSSIRVRRPSLEQTVSSDATSDPEFLQALTMARKAAEILHSRHWAQIDASNISASVAGQCFQPPSAADSAAQSVGPAVAVVEVSRAGETTAEIAADGMAAL